MKVQLIDIKGEQPNEIAMIETMQDLIQIIKAKLEGEEEVMTIFINVKEDKIELVY